jgi:hypothetical protein
MLYKVVFYLSDFSVCAMRDIAAGDIDGVLAHLRNDIATNKPIIATWDDNGNPCTTIINPAHIVKINVFEQ